MAYAQAAISEPKEPLIPTPQHVCGMAQAANLIGDRWTLLIIREALYGVTRFDAMQADLSIPRTVLSGRLKKLCDIGVFQKRRYKEPGQRTRSQYVLTAKGVELSLPMIALMQWGEKHFSDHDGATEIVERASGAPCHVGLITERGAPISIGAAQLRVKS